MYSKTIRNKKIKKNNKVFLNYLNDCEVSKASIDLMLERFFLWKRNRLSFLKSLVNISI